MIIILSSLDYFDYYEIENLSLDKIILYFDNIYKMKSKYNSLSALAVIALLGLSEGKSL